MPELPEVETIRRQLEKLVVGKTISSIEVLNPGSFRAKKDNLIGKTIADVGRKGKVLIITSSRGRRHVGRDDLTGLPRRNDKHNKDSKNLFIHLKMSGQLEFRAKGQGPKAKGEKHKHLRVCLIFGNGDRLLFHDQRKFGWISDDPAALPPGIDALDPKLTPKKLAEILASSSRPIKQILLDQSKIAGIGNIYASEILWQAGISPLAKFKEEGKRKKEEGEFRSKVKSQKSKLQVKIQKLHSAINRVLVEAIDSGGSTMADGLYQHVGGEAGDYWPRRRVYDREGEPCPRSACRKVDALIQKTVIAHRSTYFCSSCQIT